MKIFLPTSTMKVSAVIIGVLLLCAGHQAWAQGGTTPLTGFTVTTDQPTYVQTGQITFDATLTYNGQFNPSGTITFFLSFSATCATQDEVTAPQTINPDTGQLSLPLTVAANNFPAGQYNLCARYSGDVNYAAETTNPAQGTVTIFGAAITLSGPNSIVQGQAATITVTAASAPVGGPVPSGTITLYDLSSNANPPVATLTNGVATFTFQNLAAGSHDFQGQYSGDVNYQQSYGFDDNFFVEGALVSVNPGAILAGSADTTITLNGLAFTNNSVAQLTAPQGNAVPLATTFVSATRLTAVVPAASLATAQIPLISVVTGTTTSNTAQLAVYNKFTDQVTASVTPATVPYGQGGTLAVTTNVTPAPAPQAAVPSGSISYLLNGTQITTTGPLTQIDAPGSYIAPIAPAADAQPMKLLSADFNHDGFADAVGLRLNGGNYLQLFLSAGPDNFQTEYTLYAGCGAVDVAVADLNNDGFPDIVVACVGETAQPYGTYILSNGDGSFQAPVAFATATNAPSIVNPAGIAAGDFNGDGAMDIALLDEAGDLQVFNGSQPFGTFTAQAVTTYPIVDDTYLTSVVAADFNQDGKSDLAMLQYLNVYSPNGGSSISTVVLLTSNGDGTFAPQQQSFTTAATTMAPQSFAVTDLAGTGYPSVLVADPQGDPGYSGLGQLVIYQNNGAGVLNQATDYAAVNIAAVAGAPFPVIGKPAAPPSPGYNVFYTTYNTGTDQLSLSSLSSSVQNGTLAFAAGPGLTNFGYPGNCDGCTAAYTPVVPGDFNGDGYLDLFTGATGQNNTDIEQVVPLFFNNNATITANITLPASNAGTYSLVSSYPGDLNFVAGNSAATTITIGQVLPTVVASGPTNAPSGQSVTFTATVAAVTGGAAPSGTVQFSYDTGILLGGPQTLVPGTNSATATTATAALPIGVHTITTAYSGDGNYLANTASYQITIAAASTLTLTSVTPASGYLGSTATVVSLIGSGFLPNTIAQLNGAAIATTFVSATQLQATIPASFFTTIQTGTITVTTPGVGVPSAGLPFNVTEPPVQVVLSGPPTAPPATQPTITFQLPTAYPLPITGTFTLTVQPAAAGGLVDPAVQFASGGDTFTFTLPANSTTTPSVQLQSGTLSGSITVTLTLTAAGNDITPAGLQPVVIQLPPAAPIISSLSLARDGTSLTVTIQGFSNTRDMKSANFIFTGASGATINNPNVTVPLDSAFITWYGQATSDQYGSAFTYTQTFLLTDDASTIGGVSATLVNSIGTSNSLTSQ
jgi:Bacterial Ig-like domain (group 3)/FG-GAP-like repeat